MVGEEQLKDLFKFLSFDVLSKRGLWKDAICTLSKKFAKKDPTYFDTFVIIFMSVSGRCSEISCADDTNASLEHIMVEFTASTCPSLRGKPWLFFLQHFKGTSSSTMSAQSSQAETLQKRIPSGCFAFSPASEKDSCPEEADFLRICVTSTYPADQPNREPGSLFIQLKDQSSFIAGGGGGGALEDFWGGESWCFQGRKDGGRSSLTEHHERLLKIDCKWGGVIRMLQCHRGIR